MNLHVSAILITSLTTQMDHKGHTVLSQGRVRMVCLHLDVIVCSN